MRAVMLSAARANPANWGFSRLEWGLYCVMWLALAVTSAVARGLPETHWSCEDATTCASVYTIDYTAAAAAGAIFGLCMMVILQNQQKDRNMLLVQRRVAMVVCYAMVAIALQSTEGGMVLSGAHNTRIPIPSILVSVALYPSAMLVYSYLVEEGVWRTTSTNCELVMLTAAALVKEGVGIVARSFGGYPGIWALYFVDLLFVYLWRLAFRSTVNSRAHLAEANAWRTTSTLGTSVVMATTLTNMLYVAGVLDVEGNETVLLAGLLVRLLLFLFHIYTMTVAEADRKGDLYARERVAESLRLQALREAEKQRSTRLILHELRVPLNSIVLGLEMMLSEDASLVAAIAAAAAAVATSGARPHRCVSESMESLVAQQRPGAATGPDHGWDSAVEASSSYASWRQLLRARTTGSSGLGESGHGESSALLAPAGLESISEQEGGHPQGSEALLQLHDGGVQGEPVPGNRRRVRGPFQGEPAEQYSLQQQLRGDDLEVGIASQGPDPASAALLTVQRTGRPEGPPRRPMAHSEEAPGGAPAFTSGAAAQPTLAPIRRPTAASHHSVSAAVLTPPAFTVGTGDDVFSDALNAFGLPHPLSDDNLDSLRMMKSAADSMFVIISDLLDLSRMDAGAFTVALRPMLVPRLLRECIMQMQPFAGAENVRLQVRMGPELPAAVSGDPVRLSQVLNNFLSNAIKFCAHDGTGRVTLVAELEVNPVVIAQVMAQQPQQAGGAAPVTTAAQHTTTGQPGVQASLRGVSQQQVLLTHQASATSPHSVHTSSSRKQRLLPPRHGGSSGQDSVAIAVAPIGGTGPSLPPAAGTGLGPGGITVSPSQPLSTITFSPQDIAVELLRSPTSASGAPAAPPSRQVTSAESNGPGAQHPSSTAKAASRPSLRPPVRNVSDDTGARGSAEAPSSPPYTPAIPPPERAADAHGPGTSLMLVRPTLGSTGPWGRQRAYSAAGALPSFANGAASKFVAQAHSVAHTAALSEGALSNGVANATPSLSDDQAAYEAVPGPPCVLRLSCKDSGPGIALEEQVKLFQAFGQTSTGNTYKGRGTGLGLAIVREIALKHGGVAGVISTPGAGSEFYVSIPFQVLQPARSGDSGVGAVGVGAPGVGAPGVGAVAGGSGQSSGMVAAGHGSAPAAAAGTVPPQQQQQYSLRQWQPDDIGSPPHAHASQAGGPELGVREAGTAGAAEEVVPTVVQRQRSFPGVTRSGRAGAGNGGASPGVSSTGGLERWAQGLLPAIATSGRTALAVGASQLSHDGSTPPSLSSSHGGGSSSVGSSIPGSGLGPGMGGLGPGMLRIRTPTSSVGAHSPIEAVYSRAASSGGGGGGGTRQQAGAPGAAVSRGAAASELGRSPSASRSHAGSVGASSSTPAQQQQPQLVLLAPALSTESDGTLTPVGALRLLVRAQRAGSSAAAPRPGVPVPLRRHLSASGASSGPDGLLSSPSSAAAEVGATAHGAVAPSSEGEEDLDPEATPINPGGVHTGRCTSQVAVPQRVVHLCVGAPESGASVSSGSGSPHITADSRQAPMIITAAPVTDAPDAPVPAFPPTHGSGGSDAHGASPTLGNQSHPQLMQASAPSQHPPSAHVHAEAGSSSCGATDGLGGAYDGADSLKSPLGSEHSRDSSTTGTGHLSVAMGYVGSSAPPLSHADDHHREEVNRLSASSFASSSTAHSLPPAAAGRGGGGGYGYFSHTAASAAAAVPEAEDEQLFFVTRRGAAVLSQHHMRATATDSWGTLSRTSATGLPEPHGSSGGGQPPLLQQGGHLGPLRTLGSEAGSSSGSAEMLVARDPSFSLAGSAAAAMRRHRRSGAREHGPSPPRVPSVHTMGSDFSAGDGRGSRDVGSRGSRSPSSSGRSTSAPSESGPGSRSDEEGGFGPPSGFGSLTSPSTRTGRSGPAGVSAGSSSLPVGTAAVFSGPHAPTHHAPRPATAGAEAANAAAAAAVRRPGLVPEAAAAAAPPGPRSMVRSASSGSPFGAPAPRPPRVGSAAPLGGGKGFVTDTEAATVTVASAASLGGHRTRSDQPSMSVQKSFGHGQEATALTSLRSASALAATSPSSWSTTGSLSLSHSSHHGTPSLSWLRILVADDDKSNRHFLSKLLLKRLGVPPSQLQEFPNGREVADFFHAHDAGSFDVVCLDREMGGPGLDGPDAARALRGGGFTGLILGITGASDPAEVEAFKAAGADFVVPKPVNIEGCVGHVRRFFDGMQ